MPRFSIVMPAFEVAAYLGSCLDSLLAQSFDDFEVLVVDDGSTDGSGAIMDQYAEKDPRVTALHLAENQGPGEARNFGLAHAISEYLMFVDSDDLVPEGALESINHRLKATGDPDVLVHDFAGFREEGNIEPPNGFPDKVINGQPAVFTLSQNPDILVMPFAPWNKTYRREFIVQHRFGFPNGYYEDMLWSWENLLTAQNIALHDAVCLHYRRDRPGSITGGPDARHLDIFTQYQRVFEFIASNPELARWRTKILEVSLIGLPRQYRLVPPDDRPEFHRRCAEHFAGRPDMLDRLRRDLDG
ncbi:hypothetical protein BIV57_17785 [Mangrovactinospora gilvigrisea]|uniref:Glycosyltransferase 2-like domain-containing protein n=1 Tax=Mangrovactinospora gilvigrisea TaxID=1428644 RepID=A0A1J7BC24_9ACTN|nr:glycosyltransferase family 2 protein [Mangrovactinospora gilvigrisea]OIV36141.1 hypothetical protein BIV57_17785 [Mangrovactinospora gilvigrisea]